MTQEEFNVVFELQMRKCADILAILTASVHSKLLQHFKTVILKVPLPV